MKKVLLVLPIYNEEKDLNDSVLKLRDFCLNNLSCKYLWNIVIVDNASTDCSAKIAQKLCKSFKDLDYYYLSQKGRGRALKEVWLSQDYDISFYMDIDLSTDLKHLLPCLEVLDSGGANIAVGSRFTRGSVVVGRPFIRRVCSSGYIKLVKLFSRSKITDFQCGFKGITKETATKILGNILDNKWFFDTELLLLAEKSGYKIYEEPVVWTDDLDSTVRIIETAKEDIRGLYRILRSRKS